MRSTPAFFVTSAAAIFFMCTSTYAQPGTASDPVPNPVASSSAAANAQRRSDKQLAKNVRHALTKAKRRDLSFSNVRVRVSNGVVTLTGTVPDRNQVDAATQVTSAVAGVASVNNRLTVRVELNGYGGQ